MKYAVKRYTRDQQGFVIARGEVIIKTDTKQNAEYFARLFEITKPFDIYKIIEL